MVWHGKVDPRTKGPAMRRFDVLYAVSLYQTLEQTLALVVIWGVMTPMEYFELNLDMICGKRLVNLI